MYKKILLIAIICTIGFGLSAQIVPDEGFRYRINQALGQPSGYQPTIEDLNGLTGALYATDGNIISIEGAQFLTNITNLDLLNNQIINISPLSNLSNLNSLDLTSNQINDLSSLSSLINLTHLYLSENQINNISPLSGLINLTELYLNDYQIGNITALSTLINLTELSLINNQISDLSALSGLTNLLNLKLLNNQISDISPLSGLTNLTRLRLHNNLINDISTLSSLTNLMHLELSDNQINDISALSFLTNIYTLSLHDNQITDISPLVENSGLGSGDWLFLESHPFTNDPSNPLSHEAINLQIPILLSREFELCYYNETFNESAACYPSPNRHSVNVGYGSELSWDGTETGTTYAVYLGPSNDEIISIGEGEYNGENTFTISPELQPDTEYYWRVKSTNGEGELWSGMWDFTTGENETFIDETIETPQETILQSAYPNPFNPTITIKFSVKENETAKLGIYNLKGQLVKSYPIFNYGNHTALWNGTDNYGNRVGSGIYLYKLQSKSTNQVRKMLMLK